MVEISRRQPLAGPYHILLIFLFLALLIALSGYIYYRNQKAHIKKELQHELAAIAFPLIRSAEQKRLENRESGLFQSCLFETPDVAEPIA
jgi:hypothetical protein